MNYLSTLSWYTYYKAAVLWNGLGLSKVLRFLYVSTEVSWVRQLDTKVWQRSWLGILKVEKKVKTLKSCTKHCWPFPLQVWLLRECSALLVGCSTREEHQWVIPPWMILFSWSLTLNAKKSNQNECFWPSLSVAKLTKYTLFVVRSFLSTKDLFFFVFRQKYICEKFGRLTFNVLSVSCRKRQWKICQAVVKEAE